MAWKTANSEPMPDSKRSIDVQIFANSQLATEFATGWLVRQLTLPVVRSVMLAGGNTPLALYAEVATRQSSLGHLMAFALDEYVGVPLDEPRNCANLIYEKAVKPWEIPLDQYHSISSLETDALASIKNHERVIRSGGGLDVVILGLGKNGHIGFNEPGSEATTEGRLVTLNEVSINANREWFDGDYAPNLGVTTGMKSILSAKTILLLAFGSAKAPAVAAMLEETPAATCPASFLQTHPHTLIVLDELAAAQLQH
jgi:glucosamine-6-phosphate deaminase